MRDQTLERLISFNRGLKLDYATVKESVRKAKADQERRASEYAQEIRQIAELDSRRLDERIEAHM